MVFRGFVVSTSEYSEVVKYAGDEDELINYRVEDLLAAMEVEGLKYVFWFVWLLLLILIDVVDYAQIQW